MSDSIGTLPVPVHPDLAALAAGQAALFSSLAAFQAAWQAAKLGRGSTPVLGLCGLSLSLLRDRNCGASNLMLAHEAGGYIETVLAEGQAMHEAAEEILGLTLLAGLLPGADQPILLVPAQSEAEAAPVVVTPVAPAEATSQACSLTPPAPPSPEPEPPAAAPAAAPALPGDEAPDFGDEAPDPDAVAALFATLEELSKTDGAKVKAIVSEFKALLDIGRTPFVRSITTAYRAKTLADLIKAQTAAVPA
jgi:hypothetical protein